MKHTPGPWRVEALNDLQFSIIAVGTDVVAPIAVTFADKREGAVDSRANADLLAAAPCLLEAASALLEHHKGWPHNKYPPNELWDRLADAIRRASGLALLVLMLGCAQPKDAERHSSASWVAKGAVLYADRMESTPVLWGGAVLDVVTHRKPGTCTGDVLELYQNGALLSSGPSDLILASALVVGGTLHVFGTIDCTRIVRTSTTDLVNWSAPELVFQAPAGMTVWNTSVAPDLSGFILAYETCEPGTVCYSVRFLHSADLSAWQAVGDIFGAGTYTACPTVRYSNGWYYVFHARKFGNYYATVVARSQDLAAWEYAAQAVLSPLDNRTDGTNNSDLDFVEDGGTLRMRYAIGSQSSTAGLAIREATYSGTFQTFTEEFF